MSRRKLDSSSAYAYAGLMHHTIFDNPSAGDGLLLTVVTHRSDSDTPLGGTIAVPTAKWTLCVLPILIASSVRLDCTCDQA